MSAKLIHLRQVLRPMRGWYIEQVLRWVLSEGREWWRLQRIHEIFEKRGDEYPDEVENQIQRELKAAKQLLADLKSKGARS